MGLKAKAKDLGFKAKAKTKTKVKAKDVPYCSQGVSSLRTCLEDSNTGNFSDIQL